MRFEVFNELKENVRHYWALVDSARLVLRMWAEKASRYGR
jgi:hypothetical protein